MEDFWTWLAESLTAIGLIGVFLSVLGLFLQARHRQKDEMRERLSAIRAAFNMARLRIKRLQEMFSSRLYLFSEMDVAVTRAIMQCCGDDCDTNRLSTVLCDQQRHHYITSVVSEAINKSQLSNMVNSEIGEIESTINFAENRMPVTVLVLGGCVEAIYSYFRLLTKPDAYLNFSPPGELPARFDGQLLAESLLEFQADPLCPFDDTYSENDKAFISLLFVLQASRNNLRNNIIPEYLALSALALEIVAFVLSGSDKDLQKLVSADRQMSGRLPPELKSVEDPAIWMTASIERLNPILSEIDKKGAYRIRAALRDLVSKRAEYMEIEDPEWLSRVHRDYRFLEEPEARDRSLD